jgi:heme-degrading monooxygenase HmoA
MDGGWRIVSLWDSREQFQDFMRERLHLTLDDLGNDQPTITIWDVETVHAYDRESA